MNNFVDFWVGLGYNGWLFLLLILLFFVHFIMIILRSTVLTTKKRPATVEPEEGVSVIITCSNKVELLKQNLEAFLTQEYPKYEVIVVDECSEDETQDVLSDLQQKYPHLKTTRIFPETKFRRTKKIAINIGVLAAQYDVLLFSEINCKPGSGRWLHAMASYFTPDTAVVIGYSNYPVDGAGGKFRCYFRFLWFWKTMVLNRRGLQVVGNGNNMGYRKKYYLEKRGFTANTQEYIGYDTEIVKDMAKKGTVKVVKDPDTRVMICDERKKAWKDDYSYYYATKRRWPLAVRLSSDVDFIVESIVYLSAFYFIIQGTLREYSAGIIILTFLIDFIVINVVLKHLGQRKLFLTSFTVNTLGFIFQWYYNFYSIFTAKKWR